MKFTKSFLVLTTAVCLGMMACNDAPTATTSVASTATTAVETVAAAPVATTPTTPTKATAPVAPTKPKRILPPFDLSVDKKGALLIDGKQPAGWKNFAELQEMLYERYEIYVRGYGVLPEDKGIDNKETGALMQTMSEYKNAVKMAREKVQAEIDGGKYAKEAAEIQRRTIEGLTVVVEKDFSVTVNGEKLAKNKGDGPDSNQKALTAVFRQYAIDHYGLPHEDVKIVYKVEALMALRNNLNADISAAKATVTKEIKSGKITITQCAM
jgi:hypothetical protein